VPGLEDLQHVVPIRLRDGGVEADAARGVEPSRPVRLGASSGTRKSKWWSWREVRKARVTATGSRVLLRHKWLPDVSRTRSKVRLANAGSDRTGEADSGGPRPRVSPVVRTRCPVRVQRVGGRLGPTDRLFRTVMSIHRGADHDRERVSPGRRSVSVRTTRPGGPSPARRRGRARAARASRRGREDGPGGHPPVEAARPAPARRHDPGRPRHPEGIGPDRVALWPGMLPPEAPMARPASHR
jgi:hypothetical protein